MPLTGAANVDASGIADRGMLQMNDAVNDPDRTGSASGPAPGAYANTEPGAPPFVR